MKNRSLLAALLCAAPIVHAEENVEPVVVTASRVAETADAALAPVTVITRNEIERSQAANILELLRTQTGVDVARTGVPGNQTSVFLRGTNSSHVLVLVDGVRASSATDGSFAWQHLDPAQIDRIEIVRGPRSSLYGSDAIGGVIQIFTRRSKGATGRISAGTYGTYGVQAGYGGGERVRYSIEASGENSAGFNATTQDAATPYFTPDPDKDSYRNRSLSASVEAPIGDAEIAFNAWHAQANSNYDNGVQQTVNQALDARLSSNVTERWSQTLRIGSALDDLKNLSQYPAHILTHRHSADWQHTLTMGERHLLIAGLDWNEDRGENHNSSTGTTLFDRRVTDRGAYLNYSQPIGAAEIQAGVRRDHNEAFGYHTTGQASLGYDATSNMRLLASYGTAFKAPTLNDLYYPYSGNPNLKPESSRSGEVGMRYRVDARQNIALNLFQTDITDLIQWTQIINASWEPRNVNRARIRGLELEYGASPENWNFSAHLTLQEPRDLATDKPLLRRPDRKVALVAARHLNQGGIIRAESVLVGDRRDTGNRILPGYGLVNLSTIQPFAQRWRIEGRIDNLFAQPYTEAFSYATPGRVVNLAIAYGY